MRNDGLGNGCQNMGQGGGGEADRCHVLPPTPTRPTPTPTTRATRPARLVPTGWARIWHWIAVGRAKITRPPNVRPYLIGELLVVLFLLRLYDLVREHSDLRKGDAIQSGKDLFDFEKWLHIDIEPSINHWTVDHRFFNYLASYWYQYAHITISMCVLAWCWYWRPWAYRKFRNALLLDQSRRPDRLPALPGRAAAAAARSRVHRRRQAGRVRFEQRRPGDGRRVRRISVAAHRLGHLGRRGDLHAGPQPTIWPGSGSSIPSLPLWLSSPPATISSLMPSREQSSPSPRSRSFGIDGTGPMEQTAPALPPEMARPWR